MHKLSNINIELKTAICNECGKVPIEFRKCKNSWSCVIKRRNYDLLRYRAGKKKRYKVKNKANFGLCEICNIPRRLVWDHNHKTGKFRGWLCQLCNAGLGMFQDNPELLQNANSYLKTKGHYST